MEFRRSAFCALTSLSMLCAGCGSVPGAGPEIEKALFNDLAKARLLRQRLNFLTTRVNAD